MHMHMQMHAQYCLLYGFLVLLGTAKQWACTRVRAWVSPSMHAHICGGEGMAGLKGPTQQHSHPCTGPGCWRDGSSSSSSGSDPGHRHLPTSLDPVAQPVGWCCHLVASCCYCSFPPPALTLRCEGAVGRGPGQDPLLPAQGLPPSSPSTTQQLLHSVRARQRLNQLVAPSAAPCRDSTNSLHPTPAPHQTGPAAWRGMAALGADPNPHGWRMGLPIGELRAGHGQLLRPPPPGLRHHLFSFLPCCCNRSLPLIMAQQLQLQGAGPCRRRGRAPPGVACTHLSPAPAQEVARPQRKEGKGPHRSSSPSSRRDQPQLNHPSPDWPCCQAQRGHSISRGLHQSDKVPQF